MTNPFLHIADFSGYGYREMAMAADILKAYASNPPSFLEGDISVHFDAQSAEVYLMDKDYNVGTLVKGRVAQVFDCPNCGTIGLDVKYDPEDGRPFKRYRGACSADCYRACGWGEPSEEENED